MLAAFGGKDDRTILCEKYFYDLFTGTTIKDTWTKSRRRVEVVEGGGLAGMGWRDGEKRHTTVIE